MVSLPFEAFVNVQFAVFADWFIYFVKICILLLPICFSFSIISFCIRSLFKKIKFNNIKEFLKWKK